MLRVRHCSIKTWFLLSTSDDQLIRLQVTPEAPHNKPNMSKCHEPARPHRTTIITHQHVWQHWETRRPHRHLVDIRQSVQNKGRHTDAVLVLVEVLQ